jgi:hypothetical protein
MLHRVKDPSPEQRHAAEILLGRPVSEEAAVIIKSLDPAGIIPSRLSHDQRIEALKSSVQRLAGPAISGHEEEAAVNEAMRSVRPNYRPTD